MTAHAQAAPVDPLDAGAEACRRALMRDKYAGLAAAVRAVDAAAPLDPEGWFDLLARYERGNAEHARLARLNQALADRAPIRFVALNALSVAAARMKSLDLPISIKMQLALACEEIAAEERHWDDHLIIDGPRFNDLAEIASLRRFLAGGVAFSYERRLSSTIPFTVPPAAFLPTLGELAFGLRALGPLVVLHFNYARKNRLVMPQDDFERGLWRIAKTMEQQPRYVAMKGHSWLHAPSVGETFPHIAWMRDTFTNAGAFAVDTWPGRASDIVYNSAKRRQLYEEGKFLPRHTLLLWRREDVLRWAAARPDLADPLEAPIAPPPRGLFNLRIASPKPATPRRARNSSLLLWDGLKAASKGGLVYWLALLLGPAVAAAAAAAIWITPWAAAPAFVLAAALVYIIQYYVSQ